ncbi:hypothetical protein E4K67_22390 [Desulfosporosinus fructosivorans]|uniref:Phage protein Gp138 N-terminal domain-containing protein n=2 Tax=Desulfosporosinus fructosivorans TaxID=2018669 RepID=A0A4Z0R318_9FIRM|nr:hypothetical protein E4K67_22390 [Desulfosporosinus fructosivorans]
MGEKWGTDLRVAMPGIVQSFDPVEQTVTVQPSIKERIVDGEGNVSIVNLPLLLDVPISIPRAGGFALTMPVKPGDECLVIFSDMCMDAWWSQGGVQVQAEKRRHDLSDGFAILGTWSQPRRLADYSTTSAQLRSENGSSLIDIKDNEIDIVSNTVKINGVNFSNHVHMAPAGLPAGLTSGPS